MSCLPIAIPQKVRDFIFVRVIVDDVQVEQSWEDVQVEQSYDNVEAYTITYPPSNADFSCTFYGPELLSLLSDLGEDTFPRYPKRAISRLMDYCTMEEIHHDNNNRRGACYVCGDSPSAPTCGFLCKRCGDHINEMSSYIAMRAALSRREGISSDTPHDVYWVILSWLYVVMKDSEVAWEECKTHLWW